MIQTAASIKTEHSEKNGYGLLFSGSNERRTLETTVKKGCYVPDFHWFQAIPFDLLHSLTERIIELSDSSYQILIDLKRIDCFFYEFIKKFVAKFFQNFNNPFLDKRFDILKPPLGNEVPKYFTSDLKNVVILSSLAANQILLPECRAFVEVFNKRLDDFFSLWKKNKFYLTISYEDNTTTFQLDCPQLALILDYNNKQENYLLSYSLLKYLDWILRNTARLEDKTKEILCRAASPFIIPLSKYQSFELVSIKLNSIVSELHSFCRDSNLSKRKTAMFLLYIFAKSKCILEKLQLPLLKELISMKDTDLDQLTLPIIKKLIELNPQNTETALHLFQKFRSQEEEFFFLAWCTSKNFTSEKFALSVLPRIISIFCNYKNQPENCPSSYKVLKAFSRKNFIPKEFVKELLFTISSIINNNSFLVDHRHKNLKLLGSLTKSNLIPFSDSQNFIFPFLKHNQTQLQETAWFLLGDFVDLDLIPHNNFTKLLLDVLTLSQKSNSSTKLKLNIIRFLSILLLKTNLIRASNIIDLLSVQMKIDEALLTLQMMALKDSYNSNIPDLTMPPLITFLSIDSADITRINSHDNSLKTLIHNQSISKTFSQLLLILLKGIINKTSNINVSFLSKFFIPLIQANLISIEEIVAPLFTHLNFSIKKLGILFLLIFYRADYSNQIKSVPILNKYSAEVISMLDHKDENLQCLVLKLYSELAKYRLLLESDIQFLVPYLFSKISSPFSDSKKQAFSLLETLIRKNLISGIIVSDQLPFFITSIADFIKNKAFNYPRKILQTLITKQVITPQIASKYTHTIKSLIDDSCPYKKQSGLECFETLRKLLPDDNQIPLWKALIANINTQEYTLQTTICQSLAHMIKTQIIPKDFAMEKLPIILKMIPNLNFIHKHEQSNSSLLLLTYLEMQYINKKNIEDYLPSIFSILTDSQEIFEFSALQYLILLAMHNLLPRSSITHLQSFVLPLIAHRDGRIKRNARELTTQLVKKDYFTLPFFETKLPSIIAKLDIEPTSSQSIRKWLINLKDQKTISENSFNTINTKIQTLNNINLLGKFILYIAPIFLLILFYFHLNSRTETP